MISQEKIDKWVRLRAKGISVGSLRNLGHFTSKEILELEKLFPVKNILVWTDKPGIIKKD